VSLAILMGATFVAARSPATSTSSCRSSRRRWRTREPPSSTSSALRAFNNHSGSTKSYDYVREHNEALNASTHRDRDEITTQYDPGTLTTVQQHDGSILRLRKLGEEYDPSDKIAAMKRVQESLASARS